MQINLQNHLLPFEKEFFSRKMMTLGITNMKHVRGTHVNRHEVGLLRVYCLDVPIIDDKEISTRS